MTEYTIAGGSVEYRHTKPGMQYESTIPAVTLHFTVESGSDPETVTRKVMIMAKNVVEDTLKGTLVQNTAGSGSVQPGLMETAQPQPPATVPLPTQRKRKVAETPTGVVQEVSAQPTADVNPLADLDAPTPALDDLAALSGSPEPEPVTLTMKDVEVALNKASEHLRKEFGHINDLKKLIASYGVGGYSNVPPDQFADLIGKAKALCSAKKEG
jgi:hypothetical protein